MIRPSLAKLFFFSALAGLLLLWLYCTALQRAVTPPRLEDSLTITRLTSCALPRSAPKLTPDLGHGGGLAAGDADSSSRSLRHIMLAGHSRLRQIYLSLAAALSMEQLTRGSLLLDKLPLADQDNHGSRKKPPAEQVLNSTCLAASLLPNYPRDNWRCSRAAVSSGLLLDFRWRAQLAQMQQLLERLLAAGGSGSRQVLPEVLVLTGGLYLLPVWKGAPPTSWLSIIDLAPTARALAEQLRQLQQLGVDVLWQLEQPANSLTNYDNPTFQFQINVINVMLHEAMALSHVPVWSAHLPLVADWVNAVCPYDLLYSNDTLRACRTEIYHLDQRTTALLVDQFSSAVHLPLL